MSTAILSGAMGLSKTLGFDPVDAIGSIFSGGSTCSETQKKNKQQLAQKIENNSTYQERVSFIQSTGSSTSRIKPTGQGMAHFYFGEGDCKHKNVGDHHQRFLDQLEGWLRERMQQNATPQGSGYSPQVQGSGGSQAQTTQKAGTGSIVYVVYAAVAAIIFYLLNQ